MPEVERRLTASRRRLRSRQLQGPNTVACRFKRGTIPERSLGPPSLVISPLSTTILIGYRGTGKSTVAQLVAKRLSQPVYDSDVAVEERAGKTIKQLFEDDGEQCFRDLEVAVIEQLAARPNVVLALGGGAVMRAENREAIRDATVFWLKASPETIYQRISVDAKTGEQRPNLTAFGGLAEIKALLAAREPVYEACSRYIVDTEEKTADHVADEIVCLLEEYTA